jgi:hypothetical protein
MDRMYHTHLLSLNYRIHQYCMMHLICELLGHPHGIRCQDWREATPHEHTQTKLSAFQLFLLKKFVNSNSCSANLLAKHYMPITHTQVINLNKLSPASS